MDGSDNVRGAENQQERLGSFRESSEAIRRPSHSEMGEMKRWSEPCGDVGRPAETYGPPIDSKMSY